jgi:hypothetical protein
MTTAGMPLSQSEVSLFEVMVDQILVGSTDINVFIGPICWQPTDGKASRRWYFTVATSGEEGFRCDEIRLEGMERSEHEAMRQGFILGLVQRPPLVIHNMDDELDMARWCEALWPGAKIKGIRESIEAERGARA